jgi:RHS repeat-associated protein
MEVDEDGKHYNDHARSFDLGTVRFLEPDPVLSGYEAGAWNRYSYASSNPLLFIDPSGLFAAVSCYSLPFDDYQQHCFFWGYGGSETLTPTRDIDKSYATGRIPCKATAEELMSAMRADFASFANFIGNFDALGLTDSGIAAVAFGGNPSSVGQTIPISIWATVPGLGMERSSNPEVSVQSISPTSFSYQTMPGHPLFPGTITFAANNAPGGRLGFAIQVHADYASLISRGEFSVGGGGNLEDKTWQNLLSQVRSFCGGSNPTASQGPK